MNATEDGMEPVGEAPPINPLSIEPAVWMNAFAAIAEVRKLHYPNGGPSRLCHACVEPSPCPTIAAFDKWGV